MASSNSASPTVHETVYSHHCLCCCHHIDESKQNTCPSGLKLSTCITVCSLFSSCVNSINYLIVFFIYYTYIFFLSCLILKKKHKNSDRIHKESVQRPGLCVVIQGWALNKCISSLFLLTPSIDRHVHEGPANRINCISLSVCIFNCSAYYALY